MNIVSIDPSLRSTGVYSIRDMDTSSSYVIRDKLDRIEMLGKYYNTFTEMAGYYDALFIEDYAFSRHSQSVTVQAEIGGLARGAFASRGKPVIEVPISTWKYVTGISLKKTTKRDRQVYLDTIYKKFGMGFDTTDAADAWMIYYTCVMIQNGSILPTKATEALKEQMKMKGIVTGKVEA